MKKSYHIVVFSALVILLVSKAGAQQPIPRRFDGHSKGYANATILVEAYLDLLCPDCKAAFPTILQVQDYYGPSKLNFIVHVFPLPYHRASFFAATGARVAEVLAKDVEYPWLVYAGLIFDAQEEFGNSAVYNETDDTVFRNLAKLGTDPKLGIDSKKFYDGLHDGSYREDVVVSWKFAASRSVFGTPTFAVNGVKVDADPSWTLQDWIKFIDPLL